MTGWDFLNAHWHDIGWVCVLVIIGAVVWKTS
jgi:hypothetical protein